MPDTGHYGCSVVAMIVENRKDCREGVMIEETAEGEHTSATTSKT